MNKEELVALLKQEVVPALGYTEPVCVVPAAADIAEAAGGAILSVEVEMNPGIYKSGMSVGIPGFDRVGLKYAAVLGAYLANPRKGLKLLGDLSPAVNSQAINLVEFGMVTLKLKKGEPLLYTHAEATPSAGTGASTIRNIHSNIVCTARTVNGVLAPLFQKEYSLTNRAALHKKLTSMTISQIVSLVGSYSPEGLALMEGGARMNSALTGHDMQHELSIGAASSLAKYCRIDIVGNSLMSRVITFIAGSAEGRMCDCPYAIVSSAGNGNHDLTTILPVMETARYLGSDRRHLVRALAISHSINVYIREFAGKLSVTCGCGVSAASTASTSVVWLMSGSHEQMGCAIISMSGNLAGMICDDGKIGCTLKLAAASGAALMSACLAIDKAVLDPEDDMCHTAPEDAIHNMERIDGPGMAQADRTILEIMMEKD